MAFIAEEHSLHPVPASVWRYS